MRPLPYIQCSFCCSFGLICCNCCSIDCICDILVGVDSISGVAHLGTPACVFYRSKEKKRQKTVSKEIEHWNTNYSGAPKHLLLEFLCHLGEVLGMLLGSLDNVFLGSGFGNLIDLLGHFILGSIQLRGQMLVFLQRSRENRKCHSSHLRPRAEDHGWLSTRGGRLRHALARVGSDMPF